jgi:hypothetical protein
VESKTEIKVFEDRITSGECRVEYFDDDGGVRSRSSLSARLLTPVNLTESPN